MTDLFDFPLLQYLSNIHFNNVNSLTTSSGGYLYVDRLINIRLGLETHDQF